MGRSGKGMGRSGHKAVGRLPALGPLVPYFTREFHAFNAPCWGQDNCTAQVLTKFIPVKIRIVRFTASQVHTKRVAFFHDFNFVTHHTHSV